MPVTSLKTIPIYVWIPPRYTPEYKMEVVGTDTTDITSRIYSGSITDGATDSIGTFAITIDNSDGIYTNKWSGNEIFNFYADYATTATTKRFSGYIETITYGENRVTIDGRSLASELMYSIANKSYTNSSISSILTDLISTYVPHIGTGGIESCSESITISWSQKPLFDCITELCNLANYDFFINAAGNAEFFSRGSRLNTSEAVVHGKNLKETSKFGVDYSKVRNKVTVYGKSTNGIPIMYTVRDSSLYTQLGNKWRSLSFTNENITTEDECIAKASNLLARNSSPSSIGSVTSIGLVTLSPCQKVRISDPFNAIPPSSYLILSYTHTFETGMPMLTELTIERKKISLVDIIKSHDETQQIISAVDNVDDMEFSFINDFSVSDCGTLNSMTRGGGAIRGYGSWFSTAKVVTTLPSSFVIDVSGTGLNDVSLQVSFDGGATKQTAEIGQLYDVDVPGYSIIIYLYNISTTNEINSVSIRFK